MVVVGMDLKTITYIRSEAEFSRARVSGFWDVLFSLLAGRQPYLLSFDDVVKRFDAAQSKMLGLAEVPLKDIIGSVGRSRGFSRRFLPRFSNPGDKERWRELYTLAVTGMGTPPVELYKIGATYFVKDGHHRISVAKYLGWETIQARVIELSDR